MSDLKNTPWRVVEDDKWPWEIRILDSNDFEIHSERRYACSTKQENLSDVYEAHGFPFDEREIVAAAVKEQIARVRAIVDAVNTIATKDDEKAQHKIDRHAVERLRLSSELVQALASKDAEIARLREALEPFAMVAEHDIGDDEADGERFTPMPGSLNRAPLITVGHMRAARAAFSPIPDPAGGMPVEVE